MSEKQYAIVDNGRSSAVTIEPTIERTVRVKASYDRSAEFVVKYVLIECTWNAGGYQLLPGYPLTTLGLTNGSTVWSENLAEIPEWLSEIIAAGTPTDLEHPAA